MKPTDTPSSGKVHFDGTCGETSALHASWNDLNLVDIGNLRVMVCQEGENLWSAQGLEIDYCADGTSLDDVQKAFSEGLMLTIHENLRMFKTLTGVLKPAPADVWAKFYEGVVSKRLKHSQTSLHDLSVTIYVAEAA